jgi:queuine tRNA-ribosyltransferase
MVVDLQFQVLATDPSCGARYGRFHTLHGEVETPAFMAVGTQATVKSISPDELHDLDAQIILSNTYHLYLRPGSPVIKRLGGIHRFMHWDRALLTDSGGYQVFSLAKMRKIEEQGVVFQSHLDGARHMLSPELAIRIQLELGSDIAMCFDECTPYPADYAYVRDSMERTVRWAKRCRQAHEPSGQALFGIIQGGVHLDLRRTCLEKLLEIDFDGYAIGSLAVGEPKQAMLAVLEDLPARLPRDRPRYLMGVGTPEDLVEGVRWGFDLFDCVLPTRNARNGMLFTARGNIQIKNSCHADDDQPIDPGCRCYTCTRFSRAYLRHLFMARELLAYRLNTLHNLHYYIDLMARMRVAIANGDFLEWHRDFHAAHH